MKRQEGEENSTDLHSVYPPPILRMTKSRKIRCTGHGEIRYTYIILDGNTEGKRLLKKPRCRWEN
jgi:hypothetical protein